MIRIGTGGARGRAVGSGRKRQELALLMEKRCS